MISDLSELPITGAYLRRIGAEAVHFHLATISEMVNGYPKVTSRIRFTEEGAVRVWGKADPPTDAEREGIAAEFTSTEFPRIVSLATIAEPPPGCDLSDPKTFVCHDFDGNIIMVHQRYETQSGAKGFLPWTRWSDGKWRKMEPDVMPFYGLPSTKDHSTLFLHEGAKAAKHMQMMLNGEVEANNFPWMEEMRWGAHVGWIGGVHALDRSDWRRLGQMNWKRVVVIADNDNGGKALVPEIAKHFRCPTFTIQFTDDWPEGFDLADDWPTKLFGDEGRYIGPTFGQCLQPATFATDEIVIPPEGRQTRPTIIHEVRPEFAEQWCWVEKQDMMVNLEMPQYRMLTGHFNSFIRPFSHCKDTLSVFQKRYSGNQMELTYDPSKEGTIVRDAAGLQAINLFSPSAIRPAPGDWSPWSDFLEHMFPVAEDRAQVARWCATLIARPNIRMIYGILLMSTHQGVGKGTFARVLADLVGRHNASFPSATMIVDSPFNGWLSGKRLIIVDEIYEGHSWKAYNKLKPYVTDETIEVNVKHEKTWSMPNWTHYILMSNSRAALKLEASDRRWLVPEVTEDVWPEAKFVEFYAWLRGGGLSAVAQWAHTFAERGEGVYCRNGEIAPSSHSKVQLITESRSDAERLLEDFCELLAEDKEPRAIPISTIKPWMATRLNQPIYETPHSLGRQIRERGLFMTGQRIKIGKAKETLVMNHMDMKEWDPQQLKAVLTTPGDVMDDSM